MKKSICIELKDKLTGKIYCDLINRTLYATDASMFKLVPQAVVEPKTVEDVRQIVLCARQNKIPIAPRGGGTGLAGESLSEGIVIDFSTHMNKIIQINEAESWVEVEAGVVLGELNKELKIYGKLYGPDPATADRCTLGGMIGNNSTGAHSLRYNMTSNWVKSLTVMLDDGSVCELKKREINSPEFKKLLEIDTREAQIYKKCLELLTQNSELIDQKWPSTPRNRHGYLLKHVLGEREGKTTIDLAQLICASEGTLALVISAKLEVSDIPKHKSLIWPGFKNRRLAAQATAPLLKYNPAAVEIIDEICLDMAREDSTYQEIFGPEVRAILLIEFDGETQGEIEKKIDQLEAELVGNGSDGKMAISIGRCENESMRETVWQMRKLIAGMINRVPGNFKPVPVIEDVCVRPEVLPEYLDGVDRILAARGLKFLCYGHAGDGTAHIRPFIDLKSQETYGWLPEMCDEIYNLTMELNGTISAEHGDGYLRAPFISKQYGDLFRVFTRLKEIFDPELIFNPDKKTGCQDFSRWKESLRYGASYNPSPDKLKSILSWKEGPKELNDLIEACNGCGTCRSTLQERDMCPMYRSIGKEAASTRAKANLMRSYINGEFDKVPLKEIMDVADLCINCKRCVDDCPAKVRASDLMLELRARAVESEGLSLRIRFLTMMESFLKLGSFFPKISNFFSGLGLVRKILELMVGIDSNRTLPRLGKGSFQKRFDMLRMSRSFNSGIRVAYFVDTFSDLLDSKVADCMIEIFHHNEIEVAIPEQFGSGVVSFNYGDVKNARIIAKKNVQNLIKYVDRGYQIVCSEPTATLMLKDEYLLLNDSEDFKKVASSTVDVMKFLLDLHQEGKLKTDFTNLPASFMRFGYHRPCHAKSLEKDSSSLKLLKLIPGIDVYYFDCGCCGIAGTYGMRTKGFSNSMKIGGRLFEELESSDYQYCLTECSTCKLQIEQGASNIEVYHPLEILAKAYGL